MKALGLLGLCAGFMLFWEADRKYRTAAWREGGQTDLGLPLILHAPLSSGHSPLRPPGLWATLCVSRCGHPQPWGECPQPALASLPLGPALLVSLSFCSVLLNEYGFLCVLCQEALSKGLVCSRWFTGSLVINKQLLTS